MEIKYFITSLLLSSFSRATPNIILIISDDMGYSDIGCYSGEIKTPNLDKYLHILRLLIKCPKNWN